MRLPNYQLSRKPYLMMGVATELVLLWVMQTGEEDFALLLWLVSIPFVTIFFAIPRDRDCGWPRKVAWLTLVPLVGYIPAVALVFAPTKVLFRDVVPVEEEGSGEIT